MARRLAFCFVLGACLGTLLDGIHAYGDVLSYPNPAFGRWAWFVPLEFGLVGVGAGLAVPWLEHLTGAASGTWWTVERRIVELLLFAVLYASTTLVEDNLGAILLALVLGAIAAIRLVRREAPGDWIYALIAAVLGPLAEAVNSALGSFDYEHTDFAGIPFWLPSLWANVGLLIRRLIVPIVMSRRERRTNAGRS
jgi:hypothetical protein